ncbi:hypothetical protein T439DRAFT_356321 [Meredithblackwellia eburnea MCA 4105]
MGAFDLLEWASQLAIVSALYTGWAAVWGLVYRMFFWDVVGGTLGPNGYIPAARNHWLVTIIVDYPIIQSICILNGLVTLAWEFLRPLSDADVADCQELRRRRILLKVAFYLWCSFCSALVYQTIWACPMYLFTASVLIASLMLRKPSEVPIEKHDIETASIADISVVQLVREQRGRQNSKGTLRQDSLDKYLAMGNFKRETLDSIS